MNLTQDYITITAASIKDYTNFKRDEDSDDEEKHPYFDVGHGDFSEEHGHSPVFVVWAIIEGRLKVSKPVDPDQENFGGGETHGSLWSHDLVEGSQELQGDGQRARLRQVGWRLSSLSGSGIARFPT